MGRIDSQAFAFGDLVNNFDVPLAKLLAEQVSFFARKAWIESGQPPENDHFIA